MQKGQEVREIVERYKNREDVEYAEPDFIATAQLNPNDTYYSTIQWNLHDANGGVHMPQAWDISKGNGILVAVIDTGIAYRGFYRAPDLKETCIVDGYDFINNDLYADDDHSHGTHVAGTIAQSTNNNLGVAGIAFESCLMPVKVLNSNGSGSYSQIADGIRFAADNGADVINLSLGGSSSSITLLNAIEYAYNNGVVIIAASGNSNSSVVYPAAYDDYVIAVGATRFDQTRAYYSNYGSSLDVVAPGGDTSVDQNGDGYPDGILQNTFNPNTKRRWDFGYWFFEGTSMASPHVAGIAALLKSSDTGLSPDEIRQAIEMSAKDLGIPGRDNQYGFGLVNAADALAYISGSHPSDTPAEEGSSDALPTITITSPGNNQNVSGTVLISADAFDDIAVDRVEFFVQNILVGSDTVTPYEISWDSQAQSDGNAVISANVYDNAGQYTSDSISVIIDNVNENPRADAGEDMSGYAGQSITLNAGGSSDPDGTIQSYEWDFGDGNHGSGLTVSHTFASAGVYNVTLTVTDNRGGQDSDIIVLTINEIPNQAEVIEILFESFESGLWPQDSQNDWRQDTRYFRDGRYSANIDGSTSDGMMTSPTYDLQGKTSVTITFDWYIKRALDSGEYLAFDVSTDNGITWQEKSRLSGANGTASNENIWITENIDLEDIFSIKIRFRGSMSGSSEDGYVDSVKVTAQ